MLSLPSRTKVFLCTADVVHHECHTVNDNHHRIHPPQPALRRHPPRGCDAASYAYVRFPSLPQKTC